jgi:hypothetical protein
MDLRREAGSRWLDAGVPLHVIQRWLGHANISQTSTYLAVTDQGQHEAMARFDAQRPPLPAVQDGATLGDPRKNLQESCKLDSEFGVGDGYRTRDLLSHSQAFCH